MEVQVVRFVALLASQNQHVAKAFCRQQGSFDSTSLEYRVRRHGGGMQQGADLRGCLVCLCQDLVQTG